MKRQLALSALMVCAAAIATMPGCSSTPHPEGKPLPGLVFDHMESRPVNVGIVEVVNNYATHRHAADIGSRFVAAPDETLKKYLEARYRAQGGPGKLVLDIDEASVFVFHQDAEFAPGRWIGVAGFDEYSMTVKLNVRAENVPGFYEQNRTFTARRRVKISEHASIAEREQDQFKALEVMIHEIDAAVYKTLRDEFRLTP